MKTVGNKMKYSTTNENTLDSFEVTRLILGKLLGVENGVSRFSANFPIKIMYM